MSENANGERTNIVRNINVVVWNIRNLNLCWEAPYSKSTNPFSSTIVTNKTKPQDWVCEVNERKNGAVAEVVTERERERERAQAFGVKCKVNTEERVLWRERKRKEKRRWSDVRWVSLFILDVAAVICIAVSQCYLTAIVSMSFLTLHCSRVIWISFFPIAIGYSQRLWFVSCFYIRLAQFFITRSTRVGCLVFLVQTRS